MSCRWQQVFVVVGFGFGCMMAAAEPPRAAEYAACRAWVERVFGTGQPGGGGSYLELAYADVPDWITRGKSWRGTPYQIGNKTYSHGIAFNATKHVRVHLAQPGKTFTSDVGLENNDDTQRGAARGMGSVTFHVLVAGQEAFASPVMRLADEPRAVQVPLNGATEFELRVGDGGDGRSYDQALWAEATVTLQDGTSLRLQDLELMSGSGSPFGFSFTYGGKASAELVPQWAHEVADQAAEARTQRQITYTDPVSGLIVRIEADLYSDFPVVEWVVHLKNTGQADTPIIEGIQALDASFATASPRPLLHWANGAVASFDDFAPRETALGPQDKLRLVPGGEGRSSSRVMPYFNVSGGDSGVIMAIGWTGEWAAEFAGDVQGTVSVRAGLEHTHLLLHPGEEIRTPRIALLFYQGDRWRGQNLWRRFVLAHHRPRPDGNANWIAPITCGNWGGTSAEVHLDNIAQITQHDLPVAYYWIDAEWFGTGGWPGAVGDWRVKKDLYPQGFRPLADALHATGRKLMLWFEPERVVKGNLWYQEHRDWLLDVGGNMLLWNLGNPEARRFLTDFISDRVDEFGLDCYRQDFNMGMLAYCRAADAPDRQGITEIRYIEGLYQFWDDLLARHPGLIIDNCASGGRRLDLETLGRATPFWRTDGPRDAIAHQCHTWGLLPWIPLSATSQDRAGDDYEFRSSMCSALCLNWWVSGDVAATKIPADFPWSWALHTLAQYIQIRPFYYGDYYPLTSYSQAADVWMAYQLDLPESGSGLVVALRRPESPYSSAELKLHGLAPDADYVVTYLDDQSNRPCSGRQLTNEGLTVTLPKRPGSALLTYRRAR